jgi:hypothetical protein
MTLEEILKKESIDESDLEVLVANIRLLSEADLIRFGFKAPATSEQEEVIVCEESAVVEERPKKRNKKTL